MALPPTADGGSGAVPGGILQLHRQHQVPEHLTGCHLQPGIEGLELPGLLPVAGTLSYSTAVHALPAGLHRDGDANVFNTGS